MLWFKHFPVHFKELKHYVQSISPLFHILLNQSPIKKALVELSSMLKRPGNIHIPFVLSVSLHALLKPKTVMANGHSF